MQKIHTLESLIITPNTTYPAFKAFIISAKSIDGEFYCADTDVESIYKDFWSKKLTNEQKVPAIAHMLYALELENGDKFRYIQANIEEETPKN